MINVGSRSGTHWLEPGRENPEQRQCLPTRGEVDGPDLHDSEGIHTLNDDGSRDRYGEYAAPVLEEAEENPSRAWRRTESKCLGPPPGADDFDWGVLLSRSLLD